MSEASCGFETDSGRSGQRELELSGPTLTVQIEEHRTLVPIGGGLRSSTDQLYNALIDTGADASCIDTELAERLGLEVCDEQNVTGVHGPQLARYYAAKIYVPELDYDFWGEFAGLMLSEHNFAHDAILGRDFLKSFVMVYEGDTGIVTINWRQRSTSF